MARLSAKGAQLRPDPTSLVARSSISMSRLQVLADRPRLALGALLTLLLAAAAVVGSGADFTPSSATPANPCAAGPPTIGTPEEATAERTASNRRPNGTPANGTVDTENTGSLSGAF